MLNKLILGTANFNFNYGINRDNQKFSNNAIKKILDFCLQNNILNIDTASKYRGVEKKLGNFNLKRFNISTKLDLLPKNSKNIESYIFSKIKKSIKNLNIDKIENYFLHNPNDLIKLKYKKKIYQTLVKAKKIGLINNIGISVYDIEELNEIIKRYNIDVVQLPYSLFDRRFEKMIYKLKKKNINVQIRSIFLQGLLLYQLSELPKKFLRFKEFLKFNAWLKKNKTSQIEASINFVKKHKFIDNFIFGFNNIEQLRQICKLFKKNSYSFPKKIFSNNVQLIDPRKWNQI